MHLIFIGIITDGAVISTTVKKKQTVPKQHGECGRQQLGSLPAGTIVTLCFWLSLAGLTVFLWSPPAAPGIPDIL